MSYFTINRVVLVGRLTREPELRTLPSGASVQLKPPRFRGHPDRAASLLRRERLRPGGGERR
jgi:single-stranded DNA-binding protein